MGYSTEFRGQFHLDRPLQPEHAAYLLQFSQVRHMQRDAQYCRRLPDPFREAVGLPVGPEGCYFTGGMGYAQEEPTLLVRNKGTRGCYAIKNSGLPPKGAPGAWCQWVPTEDGSGLQWVGYEKFEDYQEWLEYLIQHFLKPWGYSLSGSVDWFGENPLDCGTLVVEGNSVRTAPLLLEYL